MDPGSPAGTGTAAEPVRGQRLAAISLVVLVVASLVLGGLARLFTGTDPETADSNRERLSLTGDVAPTAQPTIPVALTTVPAPGTVAAPATSGVPATDVATTAVMLRPTTTAVVTLPPTTTRASAPPRATLAPAPATPPPTVAAADPGTVPPAPPTVASTAAPTVAPTAPPTVPPTTAAPTTQPPPPTQPPAPPSVSISWGASAENTRGCWGNTNCRWIVVSATNMRSPYRYECQSWWGSYWSGTTGQSSFQPCYFGWTSGSVWVVVNGVRSNSLSV
jgi:hypothetical protein